MNYVNYYHINIINIILNNNKYSFKEQIQQIILINYGIHGEKLIIPMVKKVYGILTMMMNIMMNIMMNMKKMIMTLVKIKNIIMKNIMRKIQ